MTNPREYAREDAEREFIFKIATAHWDGEEKEHTDFDEAPCPKCDEPETDVYDLTNDDAHEWIVATIQAARNIQAMAADEEGY